MMFKKVMTTWAKEMDKQRYKEQDKRQKRMYYIDICTNHADMIQDIIEQCQNFCIATDEYLEDNNILTEIKIEEIEKCVDIINETIRNVKVNSKVYDLPPNAKQAYNDSIKHLLSGLNSYLRAYQTYSVIQQTILVLETHELTQEQVDDFQESLSNLTPPAELVEEYLYYRNLQIEKYKTALDIINSH